MKSTYLGALAFASILMVAGCGGSDGDASSGDGSGVTVGDGGTDGAAELPTSLFSEADLAPVCRGTGIPEATPFQAGAGVHPVAVLGGEDPEYGLLSVTLPDGWTPEIGEVATAELVACANRVAATESELCEGFEDEESGLAWAVQTHDATWEVTLREATTAEIVAEMTFEAEADGCPVFSTYREGDPNPKLDYEAPGADLEVFLKEHVAP